MRTELTEHGSTALRHKNLGQSFHLTHAFFHHIALYTLYMRKVVRKHVANRITHAGILSIRT